MFRLEIETMDVCLRNVARFVHVECRFDKIEDIFTGFWKLGDIATSERWVRKIAKGKKFGRTYRTGTQAPQPLVVRSYFLILKCP